LAISVNQLFDKVKLKHKGAKKWDDKIDANYRGVYVISLTDDPDTNEPKQIDFDIDENVFNEWSKRSSDLSIENKKVSTKTEIKDYLMKFWHHDQNILYIGESSSVNSNLTKRIRDYKNHIVGNKGPHTGGYWLKLLPSFKNTFIYYAESDKPRATEFKMIMYFAELVSGQKFYDINDFSKYFPFANLKVDVLKKHSIKKAIKKEKKTE